MYSKAIGRFLWALVTVAALDVSFGAGAGLEESSEENEKVKRALPGSSISVEEAYSNATAVIEGVVTDEGIISPGPPGEACYEGMKFKVTRVYKGSFKTNETVTANVFVRMLPAGNSGNCAEEG